MRIGFIALFFLLFETVHGQSNQADWKQVEAFVKGRQINSSAELRKFGQEIQREFPDSLKRLKAAYLWVIENLTYDCVGLKNKNARWALDSVLKSKKALCAGYVNVFRNLCDAAGLECIDIQGFGRSGMDDLILKRDSFAMNHTWNAVKLAGRWQLIDVTWASGFTGDDCKHFTRHRNDWYFCTDPRKFVWDHYPKDSSWQLIDQSIDWVEFRSYPLLFPGVVENRLNDFYPRIAKLYKIQGDTVRFQFATDKLYNRIIISSKKYPDLYRMDPIDSQKDLYTYVYRVEKTGDYDLQIDLLMVENLRPMQSYQVKSYTDIVYWFSVESKQP